MEEYEAELSKGASFLNYNIIYSGIIYYTILHPYMLLYNTVILIILYNTFK